MQGDLHIICRKAEYPKEPKIIIGSAAYEKPNKRLKKERIETEWKKLSLILCLLSYANQIIFF